MALRNWESYQERLTSYNESNWPSETPVYIKELVEAGFVYTGVRDLVFCFRCGVTAENWKDGDEPLSRHQSLNSKCPFLVNRSIKFSSVNLRPFKSLDDFERETFVYDWHPVYGIVQRNVIRHSLEGTNDFNSSCGNEDKYRMMNGNGSSLSNPVMSSEAKRFQSFVICPIKKHWPSPELLSNAGFYCINDKGHMLCFCCGVEVTDWESFEQDPMQRHKSISPVCRFALGLPCGNIKCNEEDLDSLESCPNNVSAYMPNIGLPNSSGNRPNMEMSYQNGDITLSSRVNNMHIGRVHSDPLNGMNCTIHPGHPPLVGYNSGNGQRLPVSYINPIPVDHYAVPGGWQLSDYNSRLQTFLTWPRSAPIQPVELAKAGFYYHGQGDKVRCYKCNVALCQWDQGDRAWTEHIKHSPACPLVIDKLRERNGMAYRNQAVTTTNNVSPTQGHLNSPPIYSFHNPYVPRRPSNPPVHEESQPQDHYPYQRPPYNFNRSPVWNPPQVKHFSNPPSAWENDTRFHHPVHQYPVATTHAYGVLKQRPTLTDQSRMMFPVQESSNQMRFPVQESSNQMRFPVQESSNQIIKPDTNSEVILQNGINNDVRPLNEEEPITSEKEPLSYPDVTHGNRTVQRTYITESDVDHVLDMGFSESLVRGAINYYRKYSPKSFPSADALAQAVIYFEKYNSLEGSPFGPNLTYSTEDGKGMVPPKPERPIDDTSDGKICKICMDNDVEITFVPCGHLTVCQSCALDMKTCPICRLEITDTVRTYFC